MILNEEMVVSALHFRATKLWNRMDDGMIFAIKLPDGETGYCCVMGNAGQHYALGLYRGEIGFSTYLKTVGLVSKNPMEMFEMFHTFDCINCDFVNASDPDLDKTAKDIIKKIASDKGLKISRPNGWPSFIHIYSGQNSIGIDNKKDAADITAALKAATEVAVTTNGQSDTSLWKLGFNIGGNYPPTTGGMTIPMLIPIGNGRYEWSFTQTPPLVKDKFPKPEFDDKKEISRLYGLKQSGMYECRAVHSPMPVGSDKATYFPLIMLLVRESDGIVMPVIDLINENINEKGILKALADTIVNLGERPLIIKVCDDRTESLISDFCNKTGIKIKRETSIPELDEAWAHLFQSMQMF